MGEVRCQGFGDHCGGYRILDTRAVQVCADHVRELREQGKRAPALRNRRRRSATKTCLTSSPNIPRVALGRNRSSF
jgi:hypothetical protein